MILLNSAARNRTALIQSSPTINLVLPLFSVALLCFLLHFFFFRYSFPDVNVDEASFFSPAVSLADHGLLASPVHRSFLPGADRYTYWMPPLYLVLLGGWLTLTGTTVLAAKFLSCVLVLATAWTMTRMAASRYTRLWLAALVLVCPFILISSAFIRMEALGLLLTASSMVAVKYGASPYIKGLLAGLCIMTHPILLACAAGLALATLLTGWKPFLLFCVTFLVVVSPYLFYVGQHTDLFRAQMALQFARKAQSSLFNLQPSYLLQSVPLALLAIWQALRTPAQRPLKAFLVAGLGLTLAVVLKSNEFNYQVYTIPYVLGCLALVMEEKSTRTYRLLAPLGIYIFFAALLFAKLNKYHFTTDGRYRQVLAYLEEHPAWKGRRIYVGGNPDVASYFIMEGQDVERDIPISTSKSGALNQYNYVVEVLGLDDRPGDTTAKPWLLWPQRFSFLPAGAAYRVHVYVK